MLINYKFNVNNLIFVVNKYYKLRFIGNQEIRMNITNKS